MDTSNNKRKIIWLVVVFLILVIGALALLGFNKYYNKNKSAELTPTYSSDPTEAKNLLVPTDFPFPEDFSPSQEYQRGLNGLLEYTAIWDSSLSTEENQKIFEDYMTSGGWNPFVMQLTPDMVSLSGSKENTVLNVFIKKNSENQKTEMQVHFSQSKK